MEALYVNPPALLKMSGQASILIFLVLAAQWLCGRRLQPRWRYALWLLVLLRLALPWTIPSPASLFNLLRMPPASPDAPPERALVSATEFPTSTLGSNALPRSAAGVNWILWLWSAGALGFAGYATLSHYRLYRRIAQRRPLLDEPTLNLLEDCKRLIAVVTPVTLVETSAMESPTLFGFIRPRLLLPAGFTSRFTRQEMRHVFLHELAHIKRGDVLTGWVMLALQALHWFNPLVWMAFHRMRADRELACDALALSRARPGENQSYGLTIVKLLEGFGRPVQAPSLAGILENKQQMKERVTMIARFDSTKRGLALAVSIFAGLALVTLTDAQTGGQPQKQPAQKGSTGGTPGWSLQEKLDLAQGGNSWAAYDLWDAYYRGNHGIQPDPTQADKWLAEVIKDLWVVKFEPTGDFVPTNPGEFLGRINEHSQCRSGQTKIGAASFFRTTAQGDKLVGSFLSNYPDRLKESLAKVPGVKVLSAERITPKEFIKYERSPQESLWVLEQKARLAQAGNQWAAYDLWDAYHRGHHGVQPDETQAAKWLGTLVRDTWVVRFEPTADFAPKNPGEFLDRIHQHCSCRSGQTDFGAASFFRTTRKGDKLLGSFLCNHPDQLKAGLAKVPGIKILSAERLTSKDFIEYEESAQESL